MKYDYEIVDNIAYLKIFRKGVPYAVGVSIEDLHHMPDDTTIWFTEPKKRAHLYANIVYTKDGKRMREFLHRWVIGATKGEFVDHINGDTHNCTRSNLRKVTIAQNNQNLNRNMRSKTGIRGVYWCNTYNKYVARVTVNGRVHHVGYFHDIREAEIKIKEARAKLMPYSKEGSK